VITHQGSALCKHKCNKQKGDGKYQSFLLAHTPQLTVTNIAFIDSQVGSNHRIILVIAQGITA